MLAQCYWAGTSATALEELGHRESFDLDFHTREADKLPEDRHQLGRDLHERIEPVAGPIKGLVDDVYRAKYRSRRTRVESVQEAFPRSKRVPFRPQRLFINGNDAPNPLDSFWSTETARRIR